ncbi:glutamate synthase-related protein [Nocardioides jishulii]|uniref:glutamate synthase-related protein n=1 Tax=Nocardioides jishulii TaxID=2575440 RepID=UPI001BAE8E53|nr:glutamate synthase-related protein [Nocardioides jishulii]
MGRISTGGKVAGLAAAALGGVVAHDLTQRQHAILRNFPVIGHFRYWVETVGPELRQYIVTSNDEERPFSRDQRRWVYASVPENALVAFALGVDMVNVGREAMLSIGCIQAQKCHTDHCPVGVATQNPRYTRGLDPTSKTQRLANYVLALRRDLLKVSEAVGVVHPGLLTADDIDILDGQRSAVPLRQLYGYEPGWGELSQGLTDDLVHVMAHLGEDQGEDDG